MLIIRFHFFPFKIIISKISFFVEVICFHKMVYADTHKLISLCLLVAQSCLLFVTPWTVACQTPLYMEFSRQEYWSGLPFPTPGYLPNPWIEPGSSLQFEPPGSHLYNHYELFHRKLICCCCCLLTKSCTTLL